jgi:copper transport protein
MPGNATGPWIDVMVRNGQSGVLRAKEITVLLSNPDAGIETLRMTATHVEGARWQVDHVGSLPLDRWQVGVEILVSDFDKITLDNR